ncbi:hypothetical protein [Mesotoga sp.]|uniref:hypothetical protein n=1 Tax=Mesotoga sp. TaxID=2053577 RepID=UPI00345E0978
MNRLEPGVWVTSKELVSPESLSRMIDRLDRINAGRAYIQVVGRGDSYYSSALLPPAEELVQDFDALQMTIEKACEKGVQDFGMDECKPCLGFWKAKTPFGKAMY